MGGPIGKWKHELTKTCGLPRLLHFEPHPFLEFLPSPFSWVLKGNRPENPRIFPGSPPPRKQARHPMSDFREIDLSARRPGPAHPARGPRGRHHRRGSSRCCGHCHKRPATQSLGSAGIDGIEGIDGDSPKLSHSRPRNPKTCLVGKKKRTPTTGIRMHEKHLDIACLVNAGFALSFGGGKKSNMFQLVAKWRSFKEPW